MLLAEMLGLDDQRAVDAMAFDVRWHHALELSFDEAYLTRRSVVGFRKRLVEADPELGRLKMVFERIGDEALADLGLGTTEQRMDSTLITSNIRTGGRVALFRATLEHFGQWLAKAAPDKVERLSAELRDWLGRERTGWFGAGSKGRAAAQARGAGGLA
ncbi:MAG: hypothetical protein M5U22_23115 [Thermoleophilia bacterium]|nr:hypothetical protein [Thermoleophilia bacterium]